MTQFGPDDRALVDEFEVDPFGRASRRLREVLNHLRSAPIPGKYCLIVLKPHVAYQLARLSGIRGQGPTAIEGVIFSSRRAAEIEVFKLRLLNLRVLELGVAPARGAML